MINPNDPVFTNYHPNHLADQEKEKKIQEFNQPLISPKAQRNTQHVSFVQYKESYINPNSLREYHDPNSFREYHTIQPTMPTPPLNPHIASNSSWCPINSFGIPAEEDKNCITITILNNSKWKFLQRLNPYAPEINTMFFEKMQTDASNKSRIKYFAQVFRISRTLQTEYFVVNAIEVKNNISIPVTYVKSTCLFVEISIIINEKADNKFGDLVIGEQVISEDLYLLQIARMNSRITRNPSPVSIFPHIHARNEEIEGIDEFIKKIIDFFIVYNDIRGINHFKFSISGNGFIVQRVYEIPYLINELYRYKHERIIYFDNKSRGV